MPKTDFLSRDIVSCIRDTKGLKDSAPMPTPPDMYVDKETDIELAASNAQFEVAIVSTFERRQRLKLTGLDAWFKAEDFTLIRRVSKAQKVNDAPKCVHCQYPRSRHSERDGHCLRAGFMGNKFDPGPQVKSLPFTSVEVDYFPFTPDGKIKLDKLQQGEWLLVAVEFSGMTGDTPVCFSSLGAGKPYDVFKVNPDAIMGKVEQPNWAKPPLPDEPPTWTVVKTVGPPEHNGPITIHVRTLTAWVDLSGERRGWSEVCSLDHEGKPTVLKPEEDEIGIFD